VIALAFDNACTTALFLFESEVQTKRAEAQMAALAGAAFGGSAAPTNSVDFRDLGNDYV